MSRFPSLPLVVLAVFAALFATIQAQPVNQTVTIAEIVATTEKCLELRDLCKTIDISNVPTKGKVLSGGLFDLLFAIHEEATGLEKADVGYFENPPLVLQTFVQFENAMKGLLAAITEKSTVLINGGFKAQIYVDLTNIVAVVDALADELANRATADYMLDFYEVKASLDVLLEGCITAFSDDQNSR